MSAVHASHRFAAFRHVGYRRYFFSRFLAYFAIQIISVAVGWQIYDLTRDPFDLGLIGLFQFLPSLVLILVTGAAADRYNRRMIMGICMVVSTLCATALLLLTISGLFSPWPVYAVLIVFGIERAFLAPASQSLAPNLVPPEDLPNAIAWNSTSWQTAMIVGPVAGGLIYALGAVAPYAVGVCFFLASALMVFAIPKPAARTQAAAQSWETITAGFRYIKAEKVVLGAISLDLFAVLLGGAVALMPVFARDILDLGPWVSASCAPLPASVPSAWRSGWRRTRSATAPASTCSPGWRSSASAPLSSVFRRRPGSRSPRSSSWALPT